MQGAVEAGADAAEAVAQALAAAREIAGELGVTGDKAAATLAAGALDAAAASGEKVLRAVRKVLPAESE